MHAQDLVIHDCSKGKEIEDVGAEAPHIGVPVFAKAFIIKAINLCNLSALVVAANESDPFGVSHLQQQTV